MVPRECPDVPADILNPRSTWSDQAEYDAKAEELAGRFYENFKSYANDVSQEVLEQDLYSKYTVSS